MGGEGRIGLARVCGEGWHGRCLIPLSYFGLWFFGKNSWGKFFPGEFLPLSTTINELFHATCRQDKPSRQT